MTRLHELIAEHGEALEADLREHYSHSLRDLATGRITRREAICYIRGLPNTCRLAQEMNGEIAQWGQTEVLLADIFDVLAQANWQRAGDNNRSRPKPYPRPMPKPALEALGRRLKRLKAEKGDQDG